MSLTIILFLASICVVNVACNIVPCRYSFLSVSLFDDAGLIELISANFVELLGCLISASTENVLSNNPSLGSIVSSIIISENHNFFIQVLKYPHNDAISFSLSTQVASGRIEFSHFSSVKENGDPNFRSLTTATLRSYHPGERKKLTYIEDQGFY